MHTARDLVDPVSAGQGATGPGHSCFPCDVLEAHKGSKGSLSETRRPLDLHRPLCTALSTECVCGVMGPGALVLCPSCRAAGAPAGGSGVS